MPYVVTTLRDPHAVAVARRAQGLAAPRDGSVRYAGMEVFGWVVRLPELRWLVAFDTLRGLVAYHPQDNALFRYARLTRFVHRCYDCQARLRCRRAVLLPEAALHADNDSPQQGGPADARARPRPYYADP
jgi:hypothetical protein